jgi:hypothetical protein
MIAVLPHWIDSTAVDVGKVAALVVALGVLYRYIVKPIRDTVHRIDVAVTYVESELRNNGGSTLRDKLDKLADNVCDIHGRMTQLEANQQRNNP